MSKLRRQIRYAYYPVHKWVGSEAAEMLLKVSMMAVVFCLSAFVLAWTMAVPTSGLTVVAAVMASGLMLALFTWLVLEWQGCQWRDLRSWRRALPKVAISDPTALSSEVILSANDVNRVDRDRSGPYAWNYPLEYGDD